MDEGPALASEAPKQLPRGLNVRGSEFVVREDVIHIGGDVQNVSDVAPQFGERRRFQPEAPPRQVRRDHADIRVSQ